MNKLILLTSVAMLSFGIISESRAAWNRSSKSGSCGTGCTYVIEENNNLTITGTGSSASISSSFFSGVDGFAPYEPNNTPAIKNAMTTFNNVTINGIKNFGSSSLNHLRIKGDLTISGTDYIGRTAFTHSLIEGNLNLPENVSLGTSAFWGIEYDGMINLPSTLSFSGTTSFRTATINGTLIMTAQQCISSNALSYWTRIGTEGKIYVKGNPTEVQNCKSKLSNSFQEGSKSELLGAIYSCENDCSEEVCDPGYILSDLGVCISPCPSNCASCNSSTTCTQCSNGYLMKDDGSCVSTESCNNGYHVSGTSCATNPEGCNTYTDENCSECNEGYLTNSAGLCTKTEDCKDDHFVDSEAGACKPIPGCSSFADGACSCDQGYYKKDGGCVSEIAGCGDGYLGKDGECISSANGCGAGYKDMGGFCNRIQYTPAEAAKVLTNDNNNSVTITFKM